MARLRGRRKRREKALLAERAQELWGQEDNEGSVVEAAKIGVEVKEGAVRQRRGDDRGSRREGGGGHHVEGVPRERNNGEAGKKPTAAGTLRGETRGGGTRERESGLPWVKEGDRCQEYGGRWGCGGAAVGEDPGENRRQSSGAVRQGRPIGPSCLC